MKKIPAIVLSLLLFAELSCSFSSKGEYSDLLEKYSKGKITDMSVIIENLLEGFSTAVVDRENLYFNKSTVITGSGTDIEIAFPENLKLNVDRSISDNISFADFGSDRIVLGNNKGFCVFDRDGDPLTVYKADKKENIDAVALKGVNIVFLAGGGVRELLSSEKNIKVMDPGEYLPPYKKFFRASMISSDKYLALITGIAGAYYISIFDSGSGGSRVKNIAASSFEFGMKDDYVLYVRGGTGNWSVVKYDIIGKRRDELRSLGKISDVFVAQDGFVYIKEMKSYFENLNGEKAYAPAELNIKGICRNSILSEYKNKIYIVDFNTMLERLKELNAAMTGGTD